MSHPYLSSVIDLVRQAGEAILHPVQPRVG